MSKNKEKLRDIVRDSLRKKDRSQEDFALSERLDPDAFRAQLTRNTFSPYAIETLIKLLEAKDVDDLHKKYIFQETKRRREVILPPTQSIQERVNRTIRAASSELREDVRRLYSWLGANDLAVICTLNEAPLECTTNGWNTLGESLKEGVKNGAIFLYIRPRQKVIESYSEALSEFFSRKSPQEEEKELKQRLRKELFAEGIPANRVEEVVRKGVLLYEAEWCPFWTIGMRFGFYSIVSKDGGGRDTTLFARFPFGGVSTRDSLADPNLLLFGDNRMRDAFKSYLLYCFKDDPKFQSVLSRLR